MVGESANRHGIGTKLEVTPQLGGPTQFRKVGVRSHVLGQSELTEHFGMGADASSIDRVAVTWPTTGMVTVLRDVPANSTIVIHEGRDEYLVLDPD